MKTITIFAIFLVSNICAAAQLKSQVNECFELTSIAFRLAGSREYVSNHLPDYSKSIDSYFTKFKNHQLINYIKEIVETDYIGYDAVPKATGCIMIKNGNIIINPDFDVSAINRIDKRWQEESFTKFVGLLNDFYKKTKFRSFFKQNADLYKLAEARMDSLLQHVHLDWFKPLFGEEINPLITCHYATEEVIMPLP